LAAAGADDGQIAMAAEKSFQASERGGGLGQRIQPEFEELGIARGSLGALPQLIGRCALNGDAKLADTRPWNRRSCDGNRGF
jgi:hypothetical protein